MMNVDVDVENSLMVPASERREILAISVYSFVSLRLDNLLQQLQNGQNTIVDVAKTCIFEAERNKIRLHNKN